MRLDEQDRRLLRLLQTNSRMSNQDLAEKAGMSSSSCWRRVRSLEETGVIRGYAAQLDADACGLAFQASVHVELQRHGPGLLDAFVSAVRRRGAGLTRSATTAHAD